MDDPLLLLEGRIMVSGRCVDCYYPVAVVDIMMSSSNPYHICRQKGPCSRLHVIPSTSAHPLFLEELLLGSWRPSKNEINRSQLALLLLFAPSRPPNISENS